jgi:hypothetical protein
VFFVYLLALVGLATLIILAADTMLGTSEQPPSEVLDNDPYDKALAASAELQAEAWTALHELRSIDREARQ